MFVVYIISYINSPIQEVRTIYYSVLFKRYTMTTLLSLFDVIPVFTHCFLGLRSSWRYLRRLFSVAREATHEPRPRPLHGLQIGVHVTHLWSVQKYGNQAGKDLHCVVNWRRSSNFSFRIVSTSLLAVWGRALPLCKTIPLASIPMRLLRTAGINSTASII